jgi:serine/threonine protein kinase
MPSSDPLLDGLDDTDSGFAHARTAVEQPLGPGDLVGRYRILRALGAGGVGEVYVARDERLGRDIALKVLRPYVSGLDRPRERFLFEARVTAGLRHPNIVTVYDVGESLDGRPWVALELLEGETLRARLTRGPLSVAEATRIARDVAGALMHAHAASVVHRDLKPDNIFLLHDGTVRVLDFGIAKHARGGKGDGPGAIAFRERSFTSAGNLVGTPAYMSPEQWMGQPAKTASDIFQLGLVLFRALTGTRAQGTRGAAELARAVLEPGPLPRVPAHVPAPLADLVAACLDKRASRRPTAADVHRTLDALPRAGQDRATALADADTAQRLAVWVSDLDDPTTPQPAVAVRDGGAARRVDDIPGA